MKGKTDGKKLNMDVDLDALLDSSTNPSVNEEVEESVIGEIETEEIVNPETERVCKAPKKQSPRKSDKASDKEQALIDAVNNFSEVVNTLTMWLKLQMEHPVVIVNKEPAEKPPVKVKKTESASEPEVMESVDEIEEKPVETQETKRKSKPIQKVSYDMIVAELDRIYKGLDPNNPDAKPVEYGTQKVAEVLKTVEETSFKKMHESKYAEVYTMLKDIL